MTSTAPARGRIEPIARAVAWLGFLALGHIGLTAAGTTLGTPPAPVPPDAFLDWVQQGDVAQTSFALLRLVGLAVIWYLAAITVLVLLARISGLRPLAFLADRLAMPWARQLLNHVLGAGLALTLAGGIVPVATAGLAAAAPAPAATWVHPGDPGGSTATMTAIDDTGPDGGVATMSRLPDGADGSPSDVAGGEALPVGRSVARATASMHQLADETGTWTIAPGDHLWHVAATTLETRWQRPATEPEIASYWRTLIDHNRDRLAVAGDPDVVYPGQVFELPPVPAPGH
jgi:hypothetical protein